jgi:hypothetical protein
VATVALLARLTARASLTAPGPEILRISIEPGRERLNRGPSGENSPRLIWAHTVGAELLAEPREHCISERLAARAPLAHRELKGNVYSSFQCPDRLVEMAHLGLHATGEAHGGLPLEPSQFGDT